jgi:hypothetical protein
VTVADHFAQFFEADAQLVHAVGDFVARGMHSGEVCVAILTRAHHHSIAESLRTRGIDARALEASYRYVVVDAEAMLAELVNGGRLNVQRFHERADTLLRQAGSCGQPVRVVGELVNLLAQRGMAEAVIELEEFWNELGRFHNFVLFCAYANDSLAGQDDKLYARICAAHQHTPYQRTPARAH